MSSVVSTRSIHSSDLNCPTPPTPPTPPALQMRIGLPERQTHTERRQADRLRHVIEWLPSAVVVIAATGRVEVENRAAQWLLGGSTVGLLWHEVVEQRFEIRADSGPDAMLVDGRRVSVTTRSLAPQSGQVLLLADVTESRERESRLRQLQRVSDTGGVLASIAHQIKTPLAAAILDASSLCACAAQEAVGETDRGLEGRLRNRLLERLRGLDRLTHDILNLARARRLRVEPCALSELLVRHVAHARQYLNADGVRISLLDRSGGAHVYASVDGLQSVLECLTANALQACGGAGAVHLESRRSAERILICVSDTGRGIPAAIREEIFEPFFTTRNAGHGLGLAIARSLVEAHGGALRLEPDRECTTFTIDLPLVPSRQTEADRT